MIFWRGGKGEWNELMKRPIEASLRWKEIEENEQNRGGNAGGD